jgi:hypothetical protein
MPRSPSGGIFTWGEGDEAWFGFSYYLAPDFPNPSSAWNDLTQWWSPAGTSPPLELGIPAGSTSFRIQGGWGSPLGHLLSGRDLGPVTTGQWIDWVVHVIFSSDPARGTVDVWRDGVRVVSGWRPIGGTLYPGADSYLETGIYRQTSADGAAMWQDNWAIGTSFREVNPTPAFGPPTSFVVTRRASGALTFRAGAPPGGTLVVAGRLRPWGRELNARHGLGARILAMGRGIVKGVAPASARLRLRAFVYRTGLPRGTASIVSSPSIRVLDPRSGPRAGTRRPASPR